MTLFQFDQMFLIVPKFEWSCFNYPINYTINYYLRKCF